MIISQFPPVNGLPLYATATPNYETGITDVGQRYQINGGEAEVALVLAGAVDLPAGVAIQSPAIISGDQGLTVTAYSQPQGDNISAFLTVTAGTTDTLNQYQGGYVFVNSGTGLGQKLTIGGNTAATIGNPMVITLQDIPAVALDTSSVVSLVANPFANVIINPASATNAPVGVTFYPIPAGSMGYVATRGEWLGLSQGGTAVGLGLMPSTSVAGAFETVTATGNQIASAAQALTDTNYGVISINL